MCDCPQCTAGGFGPWFELYMYWHISNLPKPAKKQAFIGLHPALTTLLFLSMPCHSLVSVIHAKSPIAKSFCHFHNAWEHDKAMAMQAKATPENRNKAWFTSVNYILFKKGSILSIPTPATPPSHHWQTHIHLDTWLPTYQKRWALQ